MSKLTEGHQWHLGSDGSAIESWPDDNKAGRLKYVRIETSRKIDLTDLYRLDVRFAQFKKRSERISKACLVIAIVLAGIFGLGLILLLMDALPEALTILWIALILPVVACGLVAPTVIQTRTRSRLDDLYVDAGLLPPGTSHSMKENQALELIEVSEPPPERNKH